MTRLVHQAALHLGARLASVGSSFLLFAWIGKVLPAADAASAYAFTYVMGFGLATARMMLQLGAGISGHERLAQRMREARRGLLVLKPALPVLFVGMATATWVHTHSALLSAAAGVIALAASLDIDLLRGAAGRASLFSLSFAIGSGTALALVVFVLPHTLDGVIVALLVQWLPTCAINLRTWPRLKATRRPLPTSFADTLGTALLSGFDGAVLNIAFFGVFAMPVAMSLQLSLVARVFVASLPMVPLLLHWMNAPAFGQHCRRVGLTESSGFMIGLLLSGVLAGAVFIGAYALVSHQPVAASTIVLYLAQLAAYASYAPHMRIASNVWSKPALIAPLAASVLAFVAVIALLSWLHFPFGAYAIIGVQMTTLLVTARWLSRHRRRPAAEADARAKSFIEE